jgi:hypothetical protein
VKTQRVWLVLTKSGKQRNWRVYCGKLKLSDARRVYRRQCEWRPEDEHAIRRVELRS